MQLITDGLYEKILLNPIVNGINKIDIVSGYATPTMAIKHITDIKDKLNNKCKDFKIKVAVGMCPVDGIGTVTHQGFKNLMSEDVGLEFSCSYVYKYPAVHSKVYIFSKDNAPVCAYMGSANYTQAGFSSKRSEAVTQCNPNEALEYFNLVEKNTIICNHGEIEERVSILNERRYREIISNEKDDKEAIKEGTPLVDIDETVTVSLLARSGEVGTRSGLNWGQRDGREPNQAYISLPASVYNTDFFPPRKTYFTVITDDGKSLICTRAQDNAKAIHTPTNNSLLGEYFRNRLNLGNGQYVAKADLEKYGRSDITFRKIDDETYFMDFSV